MGPRPVGRRRGRSYGALCALGALHISVSAAETPAGEWHMAAGDYASTRFSSLTQITAGNVRDLKLAFSFDTGTDRGQEAAPIVINNTMFIVTPYPNVVYALDLTKPGANVKWKFEPKPEAASQGVACCDLVNRGVAYADHRIFFNTLDNQTFALDAETGRELWRAKLGEIKRGESMTMAPLVVKDKVFAYPEVEGVSAAR